jgi:hypothetical protein
MSKSKVKLFNCEAAAFLYGSGSGEVVRRRQGFVRMATASYPYIRHEGLAWNDTVKSKPLRLRARRGLFRRLGREDQRREIRGFVCWHEEYCDCGLIVRMGAKREKAAAPPFSKIFSGRQITPQRLPRLHSRVRQGSLWMSVLLCISLAHYLHYWSAGTGLAEPGIKLGCQCLQGCRP